MFDLLIRAIKHPIDYAGVLAKHTISFSEHIDEGNGVHSFIFTPNSNLSWKAGQHAIFLLPNMFVQDKKWRAFSIASSCAENVIRISTNIPDSPSDFKRKLLALTPGQSIKMYGPFGEFHVQEDTRIIVGIAGGIGITPFRALLYEIANNLIPDIKIHLIYGGKNNFFAFQDELRSFSDHPKISISYLNTPEEINATIDSAVAKYHNSADYFISGSPGMIKAIRSKLLSAGIENIINDSFKGY